MLLATFPSLDTDIPPTDYGPKTESIILFSLDFLTAEVFPWKLLGLMPPPEDASLPKKTLTVQNTRSEGCTVPVRMNLIYITLN